MYNLPRWSSEFIRFLSVTPQFNFTGNIFDVYPVEIDGDITTLRLRDYIRTILVKEGYSVILGLDPFVGFSHLHGDPDTIHAILGDVLTVERTGPPSLERTLEILEKSVHNRTAYSAIILNQIVGHDIRYNSPDEFYYHLFSTSQNAEPRLLAGSSYPRFNLLIWIHECGVALPSWYTRDNSRIRQIVVPKPDPETRRALLETLTRNVTQFEDMDTASRNNSLSLIVKQTHNMQANEIISLISLVRREIVPVSDLAEAVIQYSSGISDNFWRSVDQKTIARAEEFLSNQVYGQKLAIRKVCDIINQSYLGLSRVQYSQNLNQPKGFLLLAGHEGVGKTTLAVAIKTLLLGSDHDMVTINMNDYQDDNALLRLDTFTEIDHGNFLAKIYKNPYSVILFENIESAHPNVLQFITTILRDGEVHSKEGKCVSFTGCLIICTIRLQGCCPTNLYNQKSEETVKEYQNRERAAGEIIAQFFEEQKNLDFSQLIRSNLIILRSIHHEAAVSILKSMIDRIIENIAARYHITITFSPDVSEQIELFCCQDIKRGGIGIGERLDNILVNPLSKIIIDGSFSPGEKVILTKISDTESGWEVTLSRVQ